MQVKAVKTFLNAHTLQVQHVGDSIDIEDGYAGELQKRGIIAPAAATTIASRQGFVPPAVTPPAAPIKK